MNRTATRIATTALGLLTAGLAYGLGPSSADADTIRPTRVPASAPAPSSAHPGDVALPTRPTTHKCSDYDFPIYGCSDQSDPDNVTEHTYCSTVQGSDVNGKLVIREFCLAQSTDWDF